MEYTASINSLTEQTFSASQARPRLMRLFSSITVPTWIFLVQGACFLTVLRVGHTGFAADFVIRLGMLLSVVGIYFSLHIGRKQSKVRGVYCTFANMVALVFWVLQILLRTIPLFQ